ADHQRRGHDQWIRPTFRFDPHPEPEPERKYLHVHGYEAVEDPAPQSESPPNGGLSLCGAGGDRTLVQTTATCGFYMLSLFIGFRPAPGEGHPSTGLGPVSHQRYGPPR